MRAGQSKRASLVEALTNILAGALVALISQEIILPWYGMHPSLSVNLQMVGWFTLISLIRSFLLRRLFNWFTIQ
jgi:hypothetical protein